MTEEKSKKIMMTLKPEIVDELDRMAKQWGTSRSGMVTILTKLRSEYERERLEHDVDEMFLTNKYIHKK